MHPTDFGVCRLSVVPVRLDHREASEQVTQLLFGDHYQVIGQSPDGRWCRIRIHSDQSEGWLDRKQHHSISEEYFNQINQSEYKITMDVASPVLYKKMPLTIVMGSIVPISSSELFKIEEQFAFNGESKGLGQRRDYDFLKMISGKYLSSPYQWGGKSPFGIDTAALVQMSFKIAGYPLLRTVSHQSQQGKKVESIEEIQPGDIAFFASKGGEVNHAGIILDNARIIHAYGHVRIDRLTEEGIINPESKVFTHFLHSIRRVLP